MGSKQLKTSERVARVDNLLEHIMVSGQSVILLSQARMELKQVFDTVLAEETIKNALGNPQEETDNG